MRACVRVCASTHVWSSEDSLQELILSNHVGSGDQKFSGWQSKCLCLLGHLSSPYLAL